MSELTSLLMIVAVVAVFIGVVSRIKDQSFPAEGLESLSSAIRALLRMRRLS